MSYQSDYSGAQVVEAIGKALNPDATPTEDSPNLVQSGGVASAVSAVMGSVSQRNLLDNPFFTVNQRGAADATTITGNGYFADRWQASGNGVQRVAGGGISVLGTAYHKLDNPGIAGKMVTLSILYSDGEISSNTFAWTGTAFSKTFKYGTVNIYPSANQINIGAQSVNVTAIKLELGSVSTLANDAPPNYAEELAKCQYYFYRVKASEPLYGSRSIGAANYSYFRVPVIMRATPTATKNGGTITICGQNGTQYGFSSFNSSAIDYNAIGVYLSQNASYAGEKLVMLNSGGTIDISADL